MELTSVSLIERVRSPENDEAWRQWMALYQPFIRRCLRGLWQQADLDDLTQDVLEVVLKKLPEYKHNRNPGAFRSWLREVVQNRVKQVLRATARRPAHSGGPLEEVEDQANDIAALIEKEHDVHILRGLLGRVRCQVKPVTMAAFEAQYGDPPQTPAEVAHNLGLSLYSVWAAKARVLKRLREEARGLIDPSFFSCQDSGTSGDSVHGGRGA